MLDLLFLQDNLINESLAVCDLAGIIKSKGYTCELLIEKEEKHFQTKIAESAPGIIIIPCSIINPGWGLNTIKKIKILCPNTIMIAAGSHAAFFPEIIERPEIDIVLIGEAESAILELLAKIKTKQDYSNINNLWVKFKGTIQRNPCGTVTDLINLPLPDRQIYYKYKAFRNFPLKMFSSGRGCPNNCSYCFNPALKQQVKDTIYTRKKPIRNILAEIRSIKNLDYPFRQIHFSDDLFTYDRNWVLNFCREYKKEFTLPFTINSKAEYLDQDILEKLKQAGCQGIAVGIETGNENLRRTILNRETSDQKIIETAELIKKSGLILTTFNMLNFPGETPADVFKTIELNQKIKTDNPRSTIYLPIPKTPLAEYKTVQTKTDKLLIENLHLMFPFLVKYPLLNKFIRQNLWLLKIKLFKPLWLVLGNLRLIYEKKFFNIGIMPAVKYYLLTGGPKNKTTIYSSLL